MNKMLMLALAATAFTALPAAAQTTSLTFDGLNRLYGDGESFGDNVTGDGQTVSYTEAGYVLTLSTINPVGTFYGAHIGDAGIAQTFNWHDDGDNEIGAFVTLSKIGDGLFNLASFDYSSSSGLGLTVSAGAYTPLVFNSSSGTATPNFNGVSVVRFASNGYNFNQLDNIRVSAATAAVPEPATWGMMILGFGVVGAAMRRRAKVRTTVAFA